MKRLIAFAAVLTTLAGGTAALAAGGLGKYETKLTGKGAGTLHVSSTEPGRSTSPPRPPAR